MPGIILTLSRQPDAALSRRLATTLATLTTEILNKELARTAVLIRHIPKDQWFIAGRTLEEHGKEAFRLEVTISDETNTRAEKARFHRAAFDRLSEIIGNLHPHSNIHVVDCRATAYGYGGETQNARLIRAEG